MPSRDLPNSHTTRDAALLSANNKYTTTYIPLRLISPAQFTQWLDLANPTSTYKVWKTERQEAAAALAAQADQTNNLPPLERFLRQSISSPSSVRFSSTAFR